MVSIIIRSNRISKLGNGQQLSGQKTIEQQKGTDGACHWRAEASGWSIVEVNDIQLMFCIQTRALEFFEKHIAGAKVTDYYPSLRAANASTSKGKDAAGDPKP